MRNIMLRIVLIHTCTLLWDCAKFNNTRYIKFTYTTGQELGVIPAFEKSIISPFLNKSSCNIVFQLKTVYLCLKQYFLNPGWLQTFGL